MTTLHVPTLAKRLQGVRSRAALLLDPAHAKHLGAFDVHLEALPAVTQAVVDLITRDYGGRVGDIPMHSRARHLDAGGQGRLAAAQQAWRVQGCGEREGCKRLLDLTILSVLLDAGAGDAWSYVERDTGVTYGRSEGLAVASYDWFMSGAFDAAGTGAGRADAAALLRVDAPALEAAFAVTPDNPLVGVAGRVSLLNRLGSVCLAHPDIFGAQDPRPGNLLDYLLAHPTTHEAPVTDAADSTGDGRWVAQLEVLWSLMMDVLVDIWPKSRTMVEGVSLGDVWPCPALARIAADPAANLTDADRALHDLLPFHKLSQWLTYSLLEPLLAFGVEFTGLQDMTGLAEYRNGGLFIDYGVLVPKVGVNLTQPRSVEEEVVVEWRGLTVALLDVVAAQVRAHYGVSAAELPLVKVLEAGTWKAGREVAARLRPTTRGPPILIRSDGTVF